MLAFELILPFDGLVPHAFVTRHSSQIPHLVHASGLYSFGVHLLCRLWRRVQSARNVADSLNEVVACL